jgi:hypothetical protein
MLVEGNEMATMNQVAEYPEILAKLVKQIKYKPLWHFELEDIERGQGSTGLTLKILITCQDSYHPDQKMNVMHYMIVPPAAYDERSWTRWILDQILLVEQHEACEFFMIDGFRPYAPHHGPGNNCYTIFDHGTQADAQTTFQGEKFELREKQ